MFETCLMIASLSGTALMQDRLFSLGEEDSNENSDVVSSAVFSPDGTLVAAGYGRFVGLLQEPRPGQAVLWDAATRQRKLTIKGHSDGVSSVRFSPDGRLLATAGYAGLIKVWDIQNNREHLLLKANGVIGAIAFSPDGSLLAAGLWSGANEPSSGNDVVVWETRAGRQVHTLAGHSDGVRDVAFSRDGRILASGGMDGLLRLWNVDSGKPNATVTFSLPETETTQVESVGFSSDGQTVAVAVGNPGIAGREHGVGEIRVCTMSGEQTKAVLKGYEIVVNQLAFSPDGHTLATAGSDGLVRFWHTESFEEIGRIKATAPIAFSRDGKSVVANIGRARLAILTVPEK